MSGSVVVIGSVNVDYVVTVEALPVAGQTVSGGRFARYGGGKGANQAVAAARAGATVRLVGCVGADAEGARAIAELAQEGIDVSGVDTTQAAATGIALIVVDAAGANQIAVAPGANRLVADMPRTVLEGATGVLLLSFEAPDSAIEVAASQAHAAGWQVLVNPAPTRPLTARLLAAKPLLVPNQHEAAALTGAQHPEHAARALQQQSGAPVIVTMGAAGALLVDGTSTTMVSAPTLQTVDTTGAGDCLCGTLAARLAAGDALLDALRVAVEAASQSTLTAGAR